MNSNIVDNDNENMKLIVQKSSKDYLKKLKN